MRPLPNAPRLGAARLAVLGLVLVATGLAAAPAHAQLLPSFGRDRAGTSGFQFLKVSPDPRASALGETVVANAFDATALFWNPALAARTSGLNIGAAHTAYFADVTMDYAAVTAPVGPFTLGASVLALGTDAMQVTTEFQPMGTGQTFRYADLAAGLSVAQSLSDLFSYGVTAKYVRESTADLVTQTVMLDLGIFYEVGTTGATMAVAIRNFGLDGTPQGELIRDTIEEGEVVEDDFASITPPTTFMLGLTYDVFREGGANALQVSGQLTNPNDNAESFNLGAEYVWNDLLALRTGYRFGVEAMTLPSFGLGLTLPFAGPELRFDYGFARMDLLGAVHRVGLNLAL